MTAPSADQDLWVLIDLALGTGLFIFLSALNMLVLRSLGCVAYFESYGWHTITEFREHPEVIPVSVYLICWLPYVLAPASVVVGYALLFSQLSVFDIILICAVPGCIIGLLSVPAFLPATSDPDQTVINQTVIEKILVQGTIRYQILNFCFLLAGATSGVLLTNLFV